MSEMNVLHRFELRRENGRDFTCAARSDWQPGWDVVDRILDGDLKHAVPYVVYDLEGEHCVATAGQDDQATNEVAAMELARLAAQVTELTRQRDEAVEALNTLAEFSDRIECGAWQFNNCDGFDAEQFMDDVRALLARAKEANNGG